MRATPSGVASTGDGAGDEDVSIHAVILVMGAIRHKPLLPCTRLAQMSEKRMQSAGKEELLFVNKK
jgi:hypothetical protein